MFWFTKTEKAPKKLVEQLRNLEEQRDKLLKSYIRHFDNFDITICETYDKDSIIVRIVPKEGYSAVLFHENEWKKVRQAIDELLSDKTIK
jgi:hypothetical protein